MSSTVFSDKAILFRALCHARRSTNRFQTGRSIPQGVLLDILQSTMRAPSSFNLQPTQIIMVQDPAVRNELSERVMLGAGNRYRVRDCSALAVFLSDLEAGKRIRRIYELEQQWGKRHANYLASLPLASSFLLGEGFLTTLTKNVTANFLSSRSAQPMPQIESIQSWGYKNTSLLVQSYLLAATSHDLATSTMEGFDPRRAMEVLRIPDRYAIPVMVATGYPYEMENQTVDFTPRLNLEEVVFSDSFGARFIGETITTNQTMKNESEDSDVVASPSS